MPQRSKGIWTCVLRIYPRARRETIGAQRLGIPQRYLNCCKIATYAKSPAPTDAGDFVQCAECYQFSYTRALTSSGVKSVYLQIVFTSTPSASIAAAISVLRFAMPLSSPIAIPRASPRASPTFSAYSMVFA